jgi:hypothetical protein
MTEILPAVPQNPSEPRWWWQPLWHRHPIRFALVVLLVIAGGVAWGLPAGLALRGVVFPPKPPVVVTPAPVTPSPTPTPTHTRRRRTYAPQPVYTPPPTFHPTPRPTRTHRPSPRPTHTHESPPPILCPPVCPSESPDPAPDPTPKAKSPEHDASSSTKNSWSLIAWLL